MRVEVLLLLLLVEWRCDALCLWGALETGKRCAGAARERHNRAATAASTATQRQVVERAAKFVVGTSCRDAPSCARSRRLQDRRCLLRLVMMRGAVSSEPVTGRYRTLVTTWRRVHASNKRLMVMHSRYRLQGRRRRTRSCLALWRGWLIRRWLRLNIGRRSKPTRIDDAQRWRPAVRRGGTRCHRCHSRRRLRRA